MDTNYTYIILIIDAVNNTYLFSIFSLSRTKSFSILCYIRIKFKTKCTYSSFFHVKIKGISINCRKSGKICTKKPH